MNRKRRMFLKMVTASLLRRRSRMIIALLAVMVGGTILSGLVLIYNDIPRQMSSQFRSYGANVIFTPSGGNGISAESLEKAVGMIPEKELEGYTPYRYENTKIHNMPVTLAGINFDSVRKTSPYWHVAGDMPSSGGEMLAGRKTAERLGISAGDTVSALHTFEITKDTDTDRIPDYEIYTDPKTGETWCDHTVDFKVTGILETGGSEEQYLYVSIGDTEKLSLTERGADIVEVSVAASRESIEEYTSKITEESEGISAKPVKRVTASESTVLTKLQSLVFIVTAVVLILTMICVGTTMTAVIAERRREIGLRKALGAENSGIIGQFLSEGLLLGGIGGILGSALGYFFAQYVSIHVFGSPIIMRPVLVPVTVAASVLVTGLACLIPVKGAIEVDPALVLKGE